MKIKFIYVAILSLAISFAVQAQYTDYIGAGHNSDIIVSASTSDLGFDPSYLLDGSGLDTNTWVHEKEADNTAWIAGAPVADPMFHRSDIGMWLKFDFGQEYQLSDIWVWNFAEIDGASNGLRDVIIDYSTDGKVWTELGEFEWDSVAVSQENRGFQGAIFNGINTRYVMISCIDSWGGNLLGLSELKFNVGTGTRAADNPHPLNGSIHVFKENNLKWTKGHGVASQQVYLGTSNPPLYAGTTSLNSYNPGTLDPGTTYYWRINSGPVWSFTTSTFSAYGITDSTQAPVPGVPHYPLRSAPVKVTFENTPTKMLFEQPTLLTLMSENGIGYNTGYLETSDPRVATSWETIGDEACDYTKVWIESATDARIVVKQTAPLIYGGIVAHDDKANGTTYGLPGNEGYGDWAEEYYVIYPDGMHIRHATVHSGNIEGSYAEPFHYNMYTEQDVHKRFFEFNEGLVCIKGSQALRNAVDSSSVTVIHMDGTDTTFSFAPVMTDTYGPHWHGAPIQLVHINSEYKVFQIALPDPGLWVKNYWPDGCFDFDIGCDPNVWTDGYGGFTTPIGHALNYTHYDSTYTSVSNVYLNGHIKSENVKSELNKLAKSWISAPELAINLAGFSGGEYQKHERAYIFERSSADTTYLDATINASTNSPLVRPAFVFKNWGSSMVTSIKWNGVLLEEGTEFYQGNEGENKVIYINKESTNSVHLIIGGLTSYIDIVTKNSEDNLNVYPNPTKDILHAISASFEGLVKVSISSMDGEIIDRKDVIATKDKRIEIPVSNLQRGMYLVSFKWTDKVTTKKIMIE